MEKIYTKKIYLRGRLALSGKEISCKDSILPIFFNNFICTYLSFISI